MACSEWWNCLQDGWCCPLTCGSCTLYFEREDMPKLEQITVSSCGTSVVVLIYESGDVWKVQSWSCGI